MFKRTCLALLHFYQKFLSPLKPKVCRYYPSCSEYALWQFQKNKLFFAFIFTFLRILKCNPFFKGGFDYPKVFKISQSQNLCFKPKFLAQKPLHFLYIPCKEGFILLKSLKEK
ncbi:MAG: membrane protein insertion efficiency factor YidD [Campylobacter sp.]|nr:membrane protein insertion efficiency factor YidD [Campylobacter sp.]